MQAWQEEEASAQVSKCLKPFLLTSALLSYLFTGGVHSVPWNCPWTFLEGALNFGTCHPNQFYSPADRMKVEPQVPQETDWGWGFEPTMCSSLFSQPFYLFWYFLVFQKQNRHSLPSYLWVLCFALLLHMFRKELVLLL